MKEIKAHIINHRQEIVFGTIIFFVASLSFGLGYVASLQFNHAPIIIEKYSN